MKLPVSLSMGPNYCPLCGSEDVLRLPRREIIDVLLLLAMLRPFGCIDCRRRYFGFFFAKRVLPQTSPEL